MRQHWNQIAVAVVGAVAFVLIHVGLELTWEPIVTHPGVKHGWFLNSGQTIRVTAASLFVAALVVGLLASSLQLRWLRSAVAMSVGVVVTMCVMLLVKGPGTIWPLVIFMGTVFTVPPILVGMAAGVGLQKIKARRHAA